VNREPFDGPKPRANGARPAAVFVRRRRKRFGTAALNVVGANVSADSVGPDVAMDDYGCYDYRVDLPGGCWDADDVWNARVPEQPSAAVYGASYGDAPTDCGGGGDDEFAPSVTAPGK